MYYTLNDASLLSDTPPPNARQRGIRLHGLAPSPPTCWTWPAPFTRPGQRPP